MRRRKQEKLKLLKNLIKKDTNACIEWPYNRNAAGYGKVAVGKETKAGHPVAAYAHRIAYKLYYDDPGKKYVCHSCDNPPCINPKHLFLGTQKDNMLDMTNKSGRKSIVAQVRNLRKSGMRLNTISIELGLSYSQVATITRKSRNINK